MASSDSLAHKVNKVAEQLLAAAGKIIDVGQELNAITYCMLDVADNAEVDDHDLDHVPHILAWSGWMADLNSDVLDAVDGLLRAVHDLIGPSRSENKPRSLKARSASAIARSLKGAS